MTLTDGEGCGRNSVGRVLASQATAPALVRFDEPAHEYHQADGWLNSSTLADWLKSESLYYRKHITKSIPNESSSALSLGSTVHDALDIRFTQGQEALAEKIRVAPAEHCTQTGLSRSAKSKAFFAEHPDAMWVTPDDGEFIGHVLAEIERNSAVRELCEGICHTEVSIRYRYQDSHALKCRPDAICIDGRLLDWKTTRHQNPLKDFWMSVRDYCYYLSHAIYTNGSRAAGFSPDPMFYVLISTTSGAVEAVTLPQRAIDHGQRTLDRILSELSLRDEVGDWVPSTYGQVHELNIPRFFYGEDE